jgi:transcriptional regulator with XRE-family HTH domain
MADINKEFGKRLLALLKQEGLTQTKFAEIISVSQQALNKHVKGQVPESDLLVRYAEHFGVTTDYLLTGRSPWDADVVIGGKDTG